MNTQSVYPVRTVVRTLFQAVVSFAAIAPFVVDAAGLPDWSGIAVALAVCAGITRVMALPQVDEFLDRYFPWLAASTYEWVETPDDDDMHDVWDDA